MNLKFLFNKKINNGFTLAEVLITLVVVGVIAAMTIPTVIYQTKKTEYSVRLKKFYTTMSQVVKLSQAKGKNWDEWASVPHSEYSVDVAEAFQNDYILPYVSYFKVVKNGSNRRIYLNDGSYFENYKGDCLDFVFDVNGDKKPNLDGRDIFRFLYCPVGGNANAWIIKSTFIPYQNSMYSRATALSLCTNSPYYCSSLLMLDGWEFKDDYPYKI